MSKYSSYKKQQKLFENWRSFLKEEEPKSDDFCTNFSDFCKNAYGAVRANMPQINDPDTFEKEIEASPPQGLETNEPEKIPDLGKATRDYLASSNDHGEWPAGDQVSVEESSGVEPSKLSPTQKDIYMHNALDKVKSAEAGTYEPWADSILISEDGYLLDGHHRWAATIIWNKKHPEDKKLLTVLKVGMPIAKLLKVANAYTDAVGGERQKGGGTKK